ncbi:MAG: FAD-dependent monooxygenase [Alphaproteobacteria bacterium]|nr:FAD-dependent monooxygenase [Alphaproteobacteria bacterium]
MSNEKPFAEIAGAGLAGLAAAAALAQRGWRVRVHERGRDLREIGAGIYLWQNALDALRELGVYDKVATIGAPSTTPRLLLDHRGQEVDLRRMSDWVPELIVILRTELHRILAECAVKHGAEIVTNSLVLGADPEGRLEFANGLGPKADLVIGADGVFSRVRDSLRLAVEIFDMKDGCGRHLIPRKDGDSINTRRIEMWNGGRRVGIAPTSKDFHYVFLCCPESDIQGRVQQPFNLEAWVSSHPQYREYLERLPRHPEEYWRPFFNVTCSSWTKGRVAIVGDAAHGMAPNLGQGAGVAIVNAVVMARALATSKDVPEALRRWEASERPYVERTQRMSFLYGYFGTRWPRKLLDLRSRILPLLARTDLYQRNFRVAIEHKPAI